MALATARAVLDPDKTHDPDHFIAADNDAMRLRLEHVAVDVEDLLAGAAPAGYGGDFLEEDVYEDWSRDLRDEGAHLGIVRLLEGSRRHGEARRHYRDYAARMAELDLPAAPFPG